MTAVFIASCVSSIDSTDNRYKDSKKEVPEVIVTKRSPSRTLNEDFDFSPYQLQLKNETTQDVELPVNNDDLWWNYPKIDNSNKVIVKEPGYRVQVLATDNLDEAQQMRSDVYFKTNKNEIYITFQPPLYKVKIGDYKSLSGANNLAFKLNQLGFSPTQVVADTVNIQQ